MKKRRDSKTRTRRVRLLDPAGVDSAEADAIMRDHLARMRAQDVVRDRERDERDTCERRWALLADLWEQMTGERTTPASWRDMWEADHGESAVTRALAQSRVVRARLDRALATLHDLRASDKDKDAAVSLIHAIADAIGLPRVKVSS